MRTTTRSTRGFTIIELMVVVAIIGLLMSLLLPALSSSMRNARATKDKAMMKGLQQSLITSGEDFEGRFIMPQAVVRLPFIQNGRNYGYVRDRGPEGLAWNSTENLYSTMIMNKYITPDATVSPIDNNPWVGVKGNVLEPNHGDVGVPYDFDAYDPGGNVDNANTSPVGFVDTQFYTSLDDEQPDMATWANNALIGARTGASWDLTAGSDRGCWATRGPKCGYRDGNALHDESPVLKQLGPEQMFQSHVAYADGAVKMVDNLLAFKHHTNEPGSGSGLSRPVTDNQYHCEFGDEWATQHDPNLKLRCGNRDHWFQFSNNDNVSSAEGGSAKPFCVWTQDQWRYIHDQWLEDRCTWDYDPDGESCPDGVF
ncbi:MAG: prepilin-type N-terminal cleavage/methylation domain-containing protein [Phycisphaerales bacterium]|nr:prepilin-type N-terminal cleavage/methylation domain-containing protein [Phycisphaerales bacterium]